MRTFIQTIAVLLALLLCAPAFGFAEDDAVTVEAPESAERAADGADAPEIGDLYPSAVDLDVDAGEAPIEEIPEFDLIPDGESPDVPALSGNIGEDGADAEEEDGDEEECVSGEIVIEMGDEYDSGITSDELYSAYVGDLFSLQGVAASKINGDKLTGFRKHVYDKLKGFVLQVASGGRSSTRIGVSLKGTSYAFTPSSLGVSSALSRGKLPAAAESAFKDRLRQDIDQAICALRMDYPYEFYWYNPFRITGGGYSYAFKYRYSYKNGRWKKLRLTGSIEFSFIASQDYRSDTYTVRSSGVAAAKRAADNARAIVSRYAAKSDYEKLLGYKDEICGLVAYNYSAYAASKGASYNHTDPWQLVSVFDGDSSTDVVCEGYAKAFQYLCDQTRFSGNICCYCASGDIYRKVPGDGGLHMWNIVSMDNRKKYLVDVTRCDAGDAVFMAGCASGSAGDNYCVNGTHYIYSGETRKIYNDSELTLSVRDYLSDNRTSKKIMAEAGTSRVIGVGEKLVLTPNEGGVTFKTGNRKIATATASGVIKGKKAGTVTITARAVDYVTETMQVVVRKAPKKVKLSASKASLGMGQTRQLTARLSPSGCRPGVTWSSSNAGVATVDQNGLVRPVAPGKATITARTYNGKKAKCKVTVKPLPRSVAISAPREALGLGEEVALKAVLPKGSASAISWSVSGSAVAIDASGTIKAVGKGTAAVTARAWNGVAGTRTFTVMDAPTSLELSAGRLTVKKGKKAALSYKLPLGEAGGCTYKSSNAKVASVSASGRIKGRKKGRAVITVTTFNGITRTCTVIVK